MERPTHRKQLKFLTCGSVDDGKSTLIGHLLYDAKLLYADQEKALVNDNKMGAPSGHLDYSLLLDGLIAEREQKITIDVAYRYFSTKKRSFIVADTPGHAEYTRNMAVGASNAKLAVILVDVTKGLLIQTKRHIKICEFMGIRYFVFAINKMDLTGYSEASYEAVRREIIALMKDTGAKELKVIPVSAAYGDNLIKLSPSMAWYQGPALLEYLESVNITDDACGEDFIMPVQRVSRPDSSFRGLQGQVESGHIELHDEVTILPSGEKAAVEAIYIADLPSVSAHKGHPVTLQLNQELDVSRGCVISQGENLHITQLFHATILWMDDQELVQGRDFLLKTGTNVVPAVVLNVKSKIDLVRGKVSFADRVSKNEIVQCDIRLSQSIPCSKFESCKVMGSFILINRISNMTSACGRIDSFLEREDFPVRQHLDITRTMRAECLCKKPITLWFTGLSGAGKSTIANAVEKELFLLKKHTMLLDGDNIRRGLNYDLGFNEADRVENIRRFAEVSKLMNDAGLIVLAVLISPYRQDRERAKEIIGRGSFCEIYISTPLVECERRDVKGLYKKARLGQIANFTGISSRYEPPEKPDIVINTLDCSVEAATQKIVNYVLEHF